MGAGCGGCRTILAPRILAWVPTAFLPSTLKWHYGTVGRIKEVTCSVGHRASTQFLGANTMTTVTLSIQRSVQLPASRNGVTSRLLEELGRLTIGKRGQAWGVMNIYISCKSPGPGGDQEDQLGDQKANL